MRRILFCLPICLLVASDRVGTDMPVFVAKRTTSVAPKDAALPTPDQFIELAKADPIECLRASLLRYSREVTGIHGHMEKQERLGNKLNPPEKLEFWHQNQPHKVLLVWRSKPNGMADRVLFVDGANDNQMLVHPATAIARAVVGNVVSRDPDSKEAKAGGRVSVAEFGLRKAVERQLLAAEEQKKAGNLKFEYLGLKNVPEVNDRPHHMFRRTNEPPEGAEKIAKVEFGLDAETWLLTCSHLTNAEDQTIGKYFFREIKINPKFEDDQFHKSQLLK